MRRIAILASGEGTNAERIIRHFMLSETAGVALVITNKPGVGALRRADGLGVPTCVISPQGFANGEALDTLRRFQIDFIVLAGFLLKVPENLLKEYPNHVVNIHPALLPKFGGKGMYGSHVHKAVIAAGEKESGITIHYVNEHYDEGGIIFQATCPVLSDDTPETLAERVHALEYEYFPKVIEAVMLGKEPSRAL